jgi:putative ABC transport system substrate-binding protein
VLSWCRGGIAIADRKEIVALAVKSRLPAIYYDPQYVDAGGLITYGVNHTDLDWRAATYVDKILKRAKPTDLPVEQPNSVIAENQAPMPGWN